MKTNNNVKYNDSRLRGGIIAVAIAILLSALALVMVGFRSEAETVRAEGGCTISLHVYDSAQKYNDLGVWAWVDGTSGVGFTQHSAKDGEQFKKESLGNTSHTYEITLTDAQLTKMKNGAKFGFLVCAKPGNSGDPFWDTYTKETADIFVEMANAFDGNNHADVYYVRKDKVAFTDLEEAMLALEKITSARFTDKTTSSVKIEFESTSEITKTSVAELYCDKEKIAEANPTPDKKSKFLATVSFSGVAFKYDSEYELKVVGVHGGSPVSKTAFIDYEDFIKTFESKETQELEYGSFYTPEKTTFRLWAPFATSVKINIYEEGAGGSPRSTSSMKKYVPEGKPWGGVWEAELKDDFKGLYYTYTVNNGGLETETMDPHAKAAGVNGDRAMIIDLDDTDPDGWENDAQLCAMSGKPAGSSLTYAELADCPVIWEIHVKDFSISPDSGMKYKGKYLAFTEEGTTVPGTNLKTGLDYLKDLGITYVHLNPVYDYSSVDEGDAETADNTNATFNWGYDPLNYNVPEGSYSTDPTRGEVRIKEFKQMVMALHKAGIGVIMDVVYNHTSTTGGQAFHDTVPYYYHRTTKGGDFNNDSGCGNETASERTMMRKYIVDSVTYWATEYHIDGFRFDLMGLHDVVTLNTVRAKLNEIKYGGKKIGDKLIMYGEPWALGSEPAASYTNRINATKTKIDGTGDYTLNGTGNSLLKGGYYNVADKLSDGVAVFTDSGRNGLRGDNGPGQGWVNGNASDENMKKIKRMMEGGCGGEDGVYTKNGTQQVAYAAAHDNYTLWDQLKGKSHGKETALYYENCIDDDVKKCQLVAGAYLMSSSTCFMLAGEEMGRTKYGNENSYNSPYKLNQIVWSRQENFKNLYNFYKAAIDARKTSGLFKYSNFFDADKCKGDFTGSTGAKIVFTRGNLEVTLDAETLTGEIKVGGVQKAYI